MKQNTLRETHKKLILTSTFLQSATTPSDKDFYDSLSPALKKRVDAQRSQEDRHKAYADQIRVSKQAIIKRLLEIYY